MNGAVELHNNFRSAGCMSEQWLEIFASGDARPTGIVSRARAVFRWPLAF